MAKGLPTIKSSSGICKGYIVGKHPEHKFDRGKASHEKGIWGLIHSYISGPIPTTSMSGSWYIITFIDDFSRYTWVFFLKKKYEILERFTKFKASVENASGRKINSIIYHNGGDYIKSKFLQICADSGIQIQHSIPYTPQQNGVEERKNRALKEMTTCMLEAKGLVANLWAEAMNIFAHIQRIVPHFYMKGNTPLKSYFGHNMDVSNFKVLGSIAWAQILLDKRKYLQPKSIECFYLDI